MMKMVLIDFLPGAAGVINAAVQYGPKIWNLVKGFMKDHNEDKGQIVTANALPQPKKHMAAGAIA